MIQRLCLPVSVNFISNHQTQKVQPQSLRWNNRVYLIEKVGLHHTYRRGRTLFHVFSVVGKQIYFRISLNTDNLSWQLEEISDGLP